MVGTMAKKLMAVFQKIEIQVRAESEAVFATRMVPSLV